MSITRRVGVALAALSSAGGVSITRRVGVALAALSSAALIGYAFGRHSTPERIVERAVHVEVARTATRDESATIDTEAVAIAHTHIVETRSDGTRIETRRAEAIREVVREVEVVRTVEVERIVVQERLVESSRPAWRVALDLGVADAPHRVELPGVPRYLPIVAAVSVDRRIAGPIFLGAWASSSPGAGLRVAVEF